MPVKAVAAQSRKSSADTVDFCTVHSVGCRKNRYPNPDIWGHKDDRGRWMMTPDESLDAELGFTADHLEMLRGLSRDEFLAQPCKTVQMPRAEYRKKFGKSPEWDKELEDRIREGRARQARGETP